MSFARGGDRAADNLIALRQAHPGQVQRNSPLLDMPARAAKLIIAAGSDELPELKPQSRKFAVAWNAHGLLGELIEVAGCHFTLSSSNSHGRTAF